MENNLEKDIKDMIVYTVHQLPSLELHEYSQNLKPGPKREGAPVPTIAITTRTGRCLWSSDTCQILNTSPAYQLVASQVFSVCLPGLFLPA